MASSFVASGVMEEGGKKVPNASPRNMKRMPWSSNSPTYVQDHNHHGIPMCVCAPATHAGSFKCRLHRTNPQASAPPTSPPTRQASGAPVVSKTVEAK